MSIYQPTFLSEHMTGTISEINRKLRKLTFLKKCLWKFLYNYTPYRLKKMIFIVSVMAINQHINKNHDKWLEVISKLLNIKYKEAAFCPVMLKNLIWSKIINKDIAVTDNGFSRLENVCFGNMCRTHIDLTISRIYDNAPAWLLYDNIENVKKDFHAVLKSKKQLDAAANDVMAIA